MTFRNKKAGVIFSTMEADGSPNTLRIEPDHHIEANIEINPGATGSTLVCAIYGMTQEHMNHLTLVGDSIVADRPVSRGQSNTNVTFLVGEADGPLQVIFVGNVTEAWADYSSGDPCFRFQAMTITPARDAVKDGFSLRGLRSSVEIISQLCAYYGWQVQDHGGWTSDDGLKDVHLSGSFSNMLDEIKHHTGSEYRLEILNTAGTNSYGVVHIYGPQFTGDENIPVATLSKTTDLIGYPQYSALGLRLKCLLRPQLTYNSVIEVRSEYIPFAWRQTQTGLNAAGQAIGNPNKPWDGKWIVLHASHEISTRTPYGSWFTYLECQPTSLAGGKTRQVPTA